MWIFPYRVLASWFWLMLSWRECAVSILLGFLWARVWERERVCLCVCVCLWLYMFHHNAKKHRQYKSPFSSKDKNKEAHPEKSGCIKGDFFYINWAMQSNLQLSQKSMIKEMGGYCFVVAGTISVWGIVWLQQHVCVCRSGGGGGALCVGTSVCVC